MSNNHFNKKANATVDKYAFMCGSLYELYTRFRGLLRERWYEYLIRTSKFNARTMTRKYDSHSRCDAPL